MLHRQRPELSPNHPVHVTFRVRQGLPTLRRPRFHKVFRQSLARLTAQRQGFRVVHYSVQRDHVHCLVEAEGKQALANGMKSLGVSLISVVSSSRHRGDVRPLATGRERVIGSLL